TYNVGIGMAVSADGRLYVGGDRLEGGAWHGLLLAYDSVTGERLWARRYDDFEALLHIAVGGDQQPIAYGRSSTYQETALAKFAEADGQELWSQSQGSGNMGPTALLIDSAGGIYCGSTGGWYPSHEVSLAKFSARGTRQWQWGRGGAN